MSDIKPYDLGLFVTRGQIVHQGHCSAIMTALNICDRVLVFVGSAQENGTIRNPFDIQTRIELIKEIFGDKVIVKPLNDLTNEKDITPEWGSYLMDNVKRIMGKVPDVMIYGDEDVSGAWFSKEDISETIRLVLPRARVPISATQIREFLVRNQRGRFIANTHPKTHKHWDRLRGELLSTEPYGIAFKNLIAQTTKLQGWKDFGVNKQDTVLDFGEMDFEKDQNWD